VSHANPEHYQPTNVTHGIMPPLENPPRDKMQKKMLIAKRALEDLRAWQAAADAVYEAAK
jgi:methylenetetrahydrofolate--tRNA-(uracil-5-)-methyltransferase